MDFFNCKLLLRDKPRESEAAFVIQAVSVQLDAFAAHFLGLQSIKHSSKGSITNAVLGQLHVRP
jgi:hypothetical protein